MRANDKAQAVLAKPEFERYAAEMAAWTAQHDGILNSIRQSQKTGESVEALRDMPERLEHEQPKRPRVPNKSVETIRPKTWPGRCTTIGRRPCVITAEAGIVLGAQVMGMDFVMRHLALLNILWDGGVLPIGRKSSESFTLRGARLTMGLQVQEGTLRSSFDKSKGLARATGFLARFLIAWPTQGDLDDPPA